MIHTVQFACTLPKAEADALNAESGRIYTDMLVSHYRLYRKQRVWLKPEQGERWEDIHGGPTTLHAHSRDAAQQAFYKACKTAKACKALGLDTKYPYHQKRWRTTIWKSTGIRLKDGFLLLARARGLAPVQVALPSNLTALPQTAFLEARLVWDRAARHYSWHLVTADGILPEAAPGANTAAVDLGEIHPAAVTDGKETCIITCRVLRSNQQYTVKRLAELKARQDRKRKGSRRWCRLQRRKTRFLAKQKRRACDLEHKVSHALVKWAKERQVKLLVIGDVRNVADGKHLNTKSQQKIGLWSHGRQRQYITYKAEAAGIGVTLVEEAYTSQTCPGALPDGTACMQCHKPKGRTYRCPACGFTAHRDAVGSANILSQHYTGEPGHVLPPPEKYRYPFAGKRSRLDTAHVASGPTTREA
ncbi:MAG TPA: transposase [Ktedonobacterales bacterium]